jgi:hypothetical protein
VAREPKRSLASWVLRVGWTRDYELGRRVASGA